MQAVFKPSPKQVPFYAYNWGEIEDYLRYKYKRDIRDWGGRWENGAYVPETPDLDFWAFVQQRIDVGNGVFTPFHPKYWAVEQDTQPWQKEICDILVVEFGESFHVFVYW
jgi:hypothetical protein